MYKFLSRKQALVFSFLKPMDPESLQKQYFYTWKEHVTSSWPRGGRKNTGSRASKPGVSLIWHLLVLSPWTAHFFSLAPISSFDMMRWSLRLLLGMILWEVGSHRRKGGSRGKSLSLIHTQLSVCQEISSYHHCWNLLSRSYNCSYPLH